MSLIDADTGEIVQSRPVIVTGDGEVVRVGALAIPRPQEVTSPYELCDAIELALPLISDPAELAEAKAKLMAIETYMAQHTKQGRARLEAALRRIEMRMGEVLGDAERGGDRGNQHTGGKLSAGNLPELPKKERHELRLLAAHRDVAEQVIAKSDDRKPPSRRQVLDAIRDHLASQRKEEQVEPGNTRQAVADLAALGLTTQRIAEELDLSQDRVSRVAMDNGIRLRADNGRINSHEREHRIQTAQQMASEGHTSRQIAATLGMSFESFRDFASRNKLVIPADAVVGRSGRIDPIRVISQTVADLEASAFSLDVLPDVTTADLDPTQVADWVISLEQSLRALTRFKNQLKEITQ